MTRATMAHVVPNSMFGSPTSLPLPLLLILAKSLVTSDVREPSAETEVSDIRATVTRMDVT